jgi:EAL domain-containing protein (putative c-di-GMP-specific phosphodiesterase class I)
MLMTADSPCGLSRFAADRRLTACNDTYRQIYNLPDRLVQPGTPSMAIVRYFLESETGVTPSQARADAREWTARHMDQLAMAMSSAYAHFLSDGRVIFVRNESLPEGGWAEAHEDITAKWRADAQILHLHDGSKAHRVALDERLREALSRAARGERFAILFLAFDTFKAVTEGIGKPINDADLHKALDDREFELKYQPIVNLARNEIVSSEALIRWRKPDVGLVLPGEFIALADKTGFIVPLGEWILKQACATARSWPDDVRIAVNVSAAQLGMVGFVEAVVGALEASSLAASRLELEIAEIALSRDDKRTRDALSEIRNIGVRIALENFGAGYSSLDYLTRFPVDIIKIDPSLIHPATVQGGCEETFRAVVKLARSLAPTTTVKGIESDDQLNFARDVGCDEGQGYFICPPLPVEGSDRAWRPGSQAGPRETFPVTTDMSPANSGRREAAPPSHSHS